MENNPILDGGRSDFAIQKFGRNPDIDSGTPEDVWDGGGTYAFPSAAAATIVTSDNAGDDVGGIGAETVTVEGLDGDYNFVSESANLNGTGIVALSNQYVRVFRAYIGTVGSNGVNVGNITIQHGATTVLAQISAGLGQTLMAIYTVPADYPPVRFLRWYGAIGRAVTTTATLTLKARLFGEGWRVQSVVDLNTSGTTAFSLNFPVTPIAQPKTDIIVTAEVSANNTGVSAGFDLSQ